MWTGAGGGGGAEWTCTGGAGTGIGRTVTGGIGRATTGGFILAGGNPGATLIGGFWRIVPAAPAVDRIPCPTG